MDSPRARRIAIVGAGPSGLFAAQSLVRQDRVPVAVDFVDRLPVPYGLLRYGVAPDHQNIKAVAGVLAATFDSPDVRLHGNVELGRDVSRADLLAAYDAVIYAVGASEDQHLGIPGEDLPGSGSARTFVAWYSGHPDAPAEDLTGVEAVAVIGVGNVAVDVARILVKEPTALDVTDMPEPVLEELHRHTVRDVYVVARRGPQHGAFTTVELRELLHTEGAQVVLDPTCLEGIDEQGLDRRTKGNLEVLREIAGQVSDAPRCRLHLLFWRRPVALEGDGRVQTLVLERTRLDDTGRVVGTGEIERVAVQLVLRSIGYRSIPVAEIPFDPARNVIANVEGRVVDEAGVVQPREYAVGWVKRGPVGVIGTNKSDAAQTVRHLLEDLEADPDAAAPSADLLDVLAERGVRVTSLEDWRAIDSAEVALGQAKGRPRTKLPTWDALLDLCR
ncbi:MAG: FAD-dependent oxidoreductase [Dermatophilaceae bacterium]